MSSISKICTGTGPGIRRSWTAGSQISTGRLRHGLWEDEEVVSTESDIVKSDVRSRKSAVCVRAESGVVFTRWLERNLDSQSGDTGRDFAASRWLAILL